MSFVDRVESYLAGLQYPSVGPLPGCSECGQDGHLAVASEPHFAHGPCECCNAPLAGDRYPIHAVSPTHGIIHMDVCIDCLEYLAHGTVTAQPDLPG